MTKLEEKLIELGFTQGLVFSNMWWKHYNEIINFELLLTSENKILCHWEIQRGFNAKRNINGFRQELDNLKKDLEILKGCEENDR